MQIKSLFSPPTALQPSTSNSPASPTNAPLQDSFHLTSNPLKTSLVSKVTPHFEGGVSSEKELLRATEHIDFLIEKGTLKPNDAKDRQSKIAKRAVALTEKRASSPPGFRDSMRLRTQQVSKIPAPLLVEPPSEENISRATEHLEFLEREGRIRKPKDNNERQSRIIYRSSMYQQNRANTPPGFRERTPKKVEQAVENSPTPIENTTSSQSVPSPRKPPSRKAKQALGNTHPSKTHLTDVGAYLISDEERRNPFPGRKQTPSPPPDFSRLTTFKNGVWSSRLIDMNSRHPVSSVEPPVATTGKKSFWFWSK